MRKIDKPWSRFHWNDPRDVFIFSNGDLFVYQSNHPLEERVTVLTDDYRAEEGQFIPPERLAWDGVQSFPGMEIGT